MVPGGNRPVISPPPQKAASRTLVAFFRADPWPEMRRVLYTGPPAMALGALVGGASFFPAASRELRLCAAGASFLLVAGAALFAVVAMHAILRDDAFVAIRTDGVVFRAKASRDFRSEGATLWANASPPGAAFGAARTDGLAFREKAHSIVETHLRWEEIARARWDASRAVVVIERNDADALVLTCAFAGVDGPTLAARIEQSRQRVALGMAL